MSNNLFLLKRIALFGLDLRWLPDENHPARVQYSNDKPPGDEIEGSSVGAGSVLICYY